MAPVVPSSGAMWPAVEVRPPPSRIDSFSERAAYLAWSAGITSAGPTVSRGRGTYVI
jgi:hypothetical protein